MGELLEIGPAAQVFDHAVSPDEGQFIACKFT